MTYEEAVYSEDVDTLVNDLIAMMSPKIELISDKRVRNAVVAAALITTAQYLDGALMMTDDPRYIKLGGIADAMRKVLNQKTGR